MLPSPFRTISDPLRRHVSSYPTSTSRLPVALHLRHKLYSTTSNPNSLAENGNESKPLSQEEGKESKPLNQEGNESKLLTQEGNSPPQSQSDEQKSVEGNVQNDKPSTKRLRQKKHGKHVDGVASTALLKRRQRRRERNKVAEVNHDVMRQLYSFDLKASPRKRGNLASRNSNFLRMLPLSTKMFLAGVFFD